MDFVKKSTGLVAVLLIFTLVISGFISNFSLSKHYFGLRRNPVTRRFFYGYERAGKTTGYVLVFFGNIGLYYFSEKSVACMLTFLFLAVYCLSTLLCIQPYMDFGVLEFLLSASMNQALSLLGIRSNWSWLVIIACIGIGGMRYCLEPVHPRGEGTRDEVVQLPTSVQPPATYEVVQLPTPVQPPATYGTVDLLKMKLRKPVEIVPPKEKDGGGEKKEKDGGGGEKKEKGGGSEKGGGQGGEIWQRNLAAALSRAVRLPGSRVRIRAEIMAQCSAMRTQMTAPLCEEGNRCGWK